LCGFLQTVAVGLQFFAIRAENEILSNQGAFDANHREVDQMLAMHNLWAQGVDGEIRRRVNRIAALSNDWEQNKKDELFAVLCDEDTINKIDKIKAHSELAQLVMPDLGLKNGESPESASDGALIKALADYRTAVIQELNTMEQIKKATIDYPTTPHSVEIFNNQYRGIFRKLTTELRPFIEAYRNKNPRFERNGEKPAWAALDEIGLSEKQLKPQRSSD
jgi:hypothetical protein